MRRVERAAAAMHERGVIFNDLHMFNVIVRPDDTVAFIDFEAASDLNEGRTRTVGNPGFVAPRDRTGFDVDAYSLACLRLAMFMPLTMLFALDRNKAAQLAAVIGDLFPVPEKFLDEAVREITRGAARPAWHVTGPAAPAEADGAGDGSAGGPRWDRLAADIVGAIRASATPERTDRLFPGDIEQFAAPAAGSVSRTGRPACSTRCPRRPTCGCRNTRSGSSRGPQTRPRARTRPVRRAGRGGVHAGAARPSGRRGARGEQVPERELGAARRRPLRGPGRIRAGDDRRRRRRRRTAAGRRGPEGRGDRRGTGSPRRGARPARGGADRRRRGLLRGPSGKALLFIRLYERPGTRPTSTPPRPPSTTTWTGASPTARARCRSTTAGERCRTWPAAASASAW